MHGDVLFAAGDGRVDALPGATAGSCSGRKASRSGPGWTPVLVKGMLLVPAQRSLLFVDPRTGQSRLAWNPGEGICGAAAGAWARTVYVLSNNGYLYSLRLDGSGG